MVKEKTILKTVQLLMSYTELGWKDTVQEALTSLTSMMYSNPAATEQFQQGIYCDYAAIRRQCAQF